MKHNTGFIQGQRSFLSGDYGRSIMGFGNAIESGMDPAKVHVPLGLAYFKNGNFAEAAAELSHALARDPMNDQVLFLRGMAWFNHGEPDRALEDFNDALRYNPRRTMARIARSLVLRTMHRDAEAEQDLKEALAVGGVEVELFMREYCIAPSVHGLAMSLFDVAKRGWGRAFRTARNGVSH